MSDNVNVKPSTAVTAVPVAADEIAGVKHQRIKMQFGEEGTATDVSATDPLPVLATIDTTGLATSAKQDSVITQLQNIDAGKLEESTFTGRVGEVQASPTANTILGRLKEIQDDINTLAGAISGSEIQADILTMPTTTVQATNLDIRDLTSATDSVTAVPSVAAGALTGANPNDDTAAVTGISLRILGMTYVFNGTDWVRVRGDVTYGMDVDITRLPALPAGTNNIGDVDVLSSALPTGASTSAKQDTIIGHMDGVEGLLTTIDADTGNISTNTDRLNNASSPATTYPYFWNGSAFVGHTGDATNGLDVDVTRIGGTVAVTQSGTWDEVGINDSGNSITVDAPVGTPAFVRLSDGSSAISTLPVSLASVPSHAVTNAGTFAVQATLQAGTALAGQVSASSETSTIYNGTTALTPKFATIAASSSGNNTLVAAVTSKKIRVLAYNFIANGTVNAKFQSGAGGTDLTGLKYCVANMGIVAPYNPLGWFETASNTLLNLNLSGAVAVGGELTYCEV